MATKMFRKKVNLYSAKMFGDLFDSTQKIYIRNILRNKKNREKKKKKIRKTTLCSTPK